MTEQTRAQLKDVLPYTPDSYYTDSEIELVRNTFTGETGRRLLKVIRKVMLPTIADPELPIEEINKDMFLSGIDASSTAAEHLKPIILGRQDAIKFVIGGLMTLSTMAALKEESPQNREMRRAKDSTK